jgi:hypothetical protein
MAEAGTTQVFSPYRDLVAEVGNLSWSHECQCIENCVLFMIYRMKRNLGERNGQQISLATL